MRAVLALIAILLVSACAQSNGTGLRDFRNTSNGPDEFTALPSLPLEQPADFSTLPAPTPGGVNRADSNPIGAAVVALGGRPSTSGVPQNDAALIAHASRNGVDPAIRSELFAADAQFRKNRSRLRIPVFGARDRYYAAYSGQALDAYAEQDRFRRAGVRVPSAPPQQ